MEDIAGSGSDWKFRMTIEERYKKLVSLRTLIRRLAYAQLAFLLLRTAWALSAWKLAGVEFYWTELALGAGGVLAFLLFHFGFGSGRPGRERSKAIQGYCLLSWLLMAETAMCFFWYHVLFTGEGTVGELYPLRPTLVTRRLVKSYGRLLPPLASPLARHSLRQLLQVGEGALDVLGLLAMFFGAMSVKDYVVVRRAQQRAKEQAGQAKDE